MSATTIIVLAYLGFNGMIFGVMIYKRMMTNMTKDWLSVPGK